MRTLLLAPLLVVLAAGCLGMHMSSIRIHLAAERIYQIALARVCTDNPENPDCRDLGREPSVYEVWMDRHFTIYGDSIYERFYAHK